MCNKVYNKLIKTFKNIAYGTWGPPRIKIWGVQVNCNYKIAVTEMYVY